MASQFLIVRHCTANVFVFSKPTKFAGEKIAKCQNFTGGVLRNSVAIFQNERLQCENGGFNA
jgi:hypothetical protein